MAPASLVATLLCVLNGACEGCSFSYSTRQSGILASKSQLQAYCGSHCASTFALGEWERCGIADGMLQGPGYGGTFFDTTYADRGCYIIVTSPSFAYSTSQSGILATKSQLQTYCDSKCASTFKLGQWERCGLKNAMLQGPGYGGTFTNYTYSGRGCYIVVTCQETTVTTASFSADKENANKTQWQTIAAAAVMGMTAGISMVAFTAIIRRRAGSLSNSLLEA
jgi:hypothetical protein